MANEGLTIEKRDDAIHFFVDHWEAGTHRVRFLVKPEISGMISSPLPELVPMYSDSCPTEVIAPSHWIVKPQS